MARLTLLAVGLLLGSGVGAAADPSLKSLEGQLQKLVEDTTPCVVSVVVSHAKYPDPEGGKKKPGQLGGYEPPQRMDDGRRWFRVRPELNRLDLALAENTADNLFGSGAVLDARQGLILTPYHLVEGASKVFVRASSGKGSYADIHAADTKSDLAVLKLLTPLDGLKAAPLTEVRLVKGPGGDPTLKKGAFVVAVGHPLASGAGDGNPSASHGIVSNVGRLSAPPPVAPDPTTSNPKPLHTYGGLIQLDARVTLGSSGAAVFNLDGQMVGLGSSVAAVFGSEANGGYAIPMDAKYRRIVDVLKEGREVEYGFLGISPAAGDSSVRVSLVTPGCPAELAGLMPEDQLVSVDGHPLLAPDDVHLHIGGSLAGSEVTIEYKRRGGAGGTQTRTAKVTLAKNQNPLPYIASVAPPAVFGLTVEYQSTRLLSARQPGRFGMPMVMTTPPPGLLVRDDKPTPGSPADKKFQALGPAKGYWVITHVDGKPVTTPAQFYAAAKGKASIELFVTDAEDQTNRHTITLP